MSFNVFRHEGPAPDHLPLTKTQAARLASLTGLDAKSLHGVSVADIAGRHRWEIDPALLLFRRICGKVVKTDPATGVDYPVPFATVYAEDTDCSLLGYFPHGSPWGWFFPFWCEREVVAQTITDVCGNFCVWVPEFEIEWILRFRRERICWLDLFRKPTIGAVLKSLIPDLGDPPPILDPNGPLYQKAEQILGTATVRALAGVGGADGFGKRQGARQALLGKPAFAANLPPTLPRQFRRRPHHMDHAAHAEAVRGTLANDLGLDASALGRLDPRHYCGPFLRCVDVYVPEWVPIFELPDISFRVTQDVNGDGAPDVIYDNGLFDVPWGVGPVSGVTLHASPIAISTTTCDAPVVPCGNVPSLEFVGLMPLVNPPGPAAPYVDPIAGFATRPNPPHPSGAIGGPALPPATAPYTGTLQIYGCADVAGASYYRLRYAYTAPGSATAMALTPFKGLTWPLYRVVGGNLQTHWPVSDSAGWYPVLPDSDNWFPGSMVLEWDTTAFANGLYTVQLEIADGAKNVIATSAHVGFTIDNAAPMVTYSAIWSLAADMSNPQPLPTDNCVVIKRGAVPADVYVQMTYSVTAGHLRSVQAGSGGCAAASLISPVSTTEHWHEDAGDNTFSGVATYRIPAGSPQGAYSFAIYADSRAFNPSGGDAGHLDDWNYDPVYRWTSPSFAAAVVNENP